MPLSFLFPAFLAGLAALAVPVLIHLSRRQSEQVREFPSLMFLRRFPQQTEKRRRLRDVLLLALRCAALTILVAAFARPFLDRPIASPAAQTGSREVVVLLDRSASMAYGDRWARAVAAAGEAIDGLGADDRASLLAFDDGAELLTRASPDGAVLRGALESLQPTDARSRFSGGLKLAESVLLSSAAPRRELVIVSDFQRTGWDGDEGAAGIHLPPGTRVTPVSVGGGATSNVAVTGVEFARESLSGRERVVATTRLVNQGDTPLAGLPVSLELEGRELETRSVDLPAGGPATVSFSPFTLPVAQHARKRPRRDRLAAGRTTSSTSRSRPGGRARGGDRGGRPNRAECQPLPAAGARHRRRARLPGRDPALRPPSPRPTSRAARW